MYSEFNEIFLLGMSNSELFLVKGGQEGVEFDILKRPSASSTEFHDDNSRVLTVSNDDRELRREPGDQVKEEKCKNVVGLGALKATDHDDDEEGFRTPTSTGHKISEIKQCPPAPRKSKSRTKRKFSSVSPNTRTSLRLDLSQEVNSLFPKPILDDLHRKIKRARAEEHEN